jgi:hypothetical protein
MQGTIELVLRDRHDCHDEALLLIDAVGRQNPGTIEGFRGAVLALLNSPSYSVRSRARDIASNAGWDIGAIPPESRPLRPIYKFVLPQPRPDLVADAQVWATAVLPDSEDPATLLSPFTQQLDAVARIASIPKANIYQRAVQIMHELAPRDTWSAAGEGHLRAILSSAGLKFSFRRPRAQLARHALFHIIAELIDPGRIAEEMMSRLVTILTFGDPDLLLQQPAQRPSRIASIVRRDGDRGHNEEWIGRLDEARPLVRATQSGWRVLGEHSTSKKQSSH